jgi:hypothetical protein
LTTLDQRRALALRIAKTIGRDPASIVASLRSRLDTSFKFNPRQRRDDQGRWTDGGPSVPNMPSGKVFGGGGHDYAKGGKQQTIRYKVGDGPEKSITGRVVRERPDSISVVKRGHPDSATEIIQKKHIVHDEVKPRAGTFIGNVPETHKNARPHGDSGPPDEDIFVPEPTGEPHFKPGMKSKHVDEMNRQEQEALHPSKTKIADYAKTQAKAREDRGLEPEDDRYDTSSSLLKGADMTQKIPTNDDGLRVWRTDETDFDDLVRDGLRPGDKYVIADTYSKPVTDIFDPREHYVGGDYEHLLN